MVGDWVVDPVSGGSRPLALDRMAKRPPARKVTGVTLAAAVRGGGSPERGGDCATGRGRARQGSSALRTRCEASRQRQLAGVGSNRGVAAQHGSASTARACAHERAREKAGEDPVGSSPPCKARGSVLDAAGPPA